MKNYRPVLNLSFLSKLLERVVHNLHIRREPLDGREQTQAERRQDRTSLGLFQIRFCSLVGSGRPLRLGEETITASDHVRLPVRVTILTDLSIDKQVSNTS